MPKRENRYGGPQGFGEGFGDTFKSAASEAMMMTLRDLLAQPERDARLGIAREAEKRDIAAESRRAEEYQYGVSRRPAAEAKDEADLNYKKEQAEKLKNTRPLSALQKEDPELARLAFQSVSRARDWMYKDPADKALALQSEYDILKAQRDQIREEAARKAAAKGKTSEEPAADKKKLSEPSGVDALAEKFGF